MGFDRLIAGILAGLIVDKREQKMRQSAQPQQRESYAPLDANANREKLYISARNKNLAVRYKKVIFDYVDKHSLNPYNFALSDSELEVLQYYYSRLEAIPSSFDCRTELIHFILKLWKDECKENVIDLLQNELVYLIDYMSPSSQEEHMYQHLAMFLSAECYFFKGEFANALKRLYQTLDWQEIYDNVNGNGGFDFNGLFNFHEAVVSNIINLYALAGLSEKTDEVRDACRALVIQSTDAYFSILKLSDYAVSKEFNQRQRDMLMAKNEFRGYYIISEVSYESNLFKKSMAGIIRGQAIYSIDPLPYDCKSFDVIEEQGIIDGEIVDYTSLCMQGEGTIHNYQAALERDREEMKRI